MLWTLRSAAQFARPCLRRSINSTAARRQPRTPQTLTSTSSSTSSSAKLLSFREQVARQAEPKPFSEHVPRPRIGRQILFAFVGSYVAFSVAAIETNRDTAHWTEKLMSANPMYRFRLPTSLDMARARYQELGKTLQDFVTKLKDDMSQLSGTAAVVVVWPTVKVAQSFLDMTEGRRAAWAIGAVNAVVWVAWLVPRLRPIMSTRFTHNPLSGLSYTMLTSTFSHQSIFHLGFNCMALASFGASAHLYFTTQQRHNSYGMQESTANWHFGAFFISAGLFSALLSHVVSARIKFPRLVAQLSKTAETTGARASRAAGADSAASRASRAAEILPSLGASGAIYAAVTLTALAFPDAVVSLIFPPTWPIPIQLGVGALVLVDVLGVIRGWRVFDHWAHLGGAAFGALYYAYGPQLWDWMRATNGGVMGKANGLPSIIPLEKVVPAVTEAHLLRADEVRKLGSSTQSLHHSVELAKLGPHFQLEAAIYLLSAVRFSAVPSAVFDAFAKTAEDDPHLLPIFQLARKMYKMTLDEELRTILPLALLIVLSEDYPYEGREAMEFAKAHAMHASALLHAGPAYHLVAAMSIWRATLACHNTLDDLGEDAPIGMSQEITDQGLSQYINSMQQLSKIAPYQSIAAELKTVRVNPYTPSDDIALYQQTSSVSLEERFTKLILDGEAWQKRGEMYTLHAASCFYRALRLHPEPTGLLDVYKQSMSDSLLTATELMYRLGTVMTEPFAPSLADFEASEISAKEPVPRYSSGPITIAGVRVDQLPRYIWRARQPDRSKDS